MTDNALARLLRSAEARERARHADEVAVLFNGMFEADARRKMQQATGSGNDDQRLDQMRSEQDSIRHNALEERRTLGDTLTADEERERLDLASRRTFSGYYRPAGSEAE